MVSLQEEGADTSAPGEARREGRYSLSISDEGDFAAGLRVPGGDKENLLLVQPSLAYRWGDRFRVATSLAFLNTTGSGTHAQLRVKEAYAGFSEGDFDFMAGKRLLRWGTGYAFTATGVLDPPRVATDPTDRLNLNEGREMFKADWIEGKSDVTVAWASGGLFDHRPGMRETTAVRYNTLVDGFDTSIIIAHDRGAATLAGANFTRVLGDSVELHGEFAWRQQAAVLFGGKYTARSGWQAIAEFYTPPNTPYYSQVPTTLGRQHYAYARLGKARLRELPGWKEWDVTGSVVTNLNDRSRILVFDVTRRFGNHTSAYVHAQTPSGKQFQSEYGMIPYSALVSAGITVQI
jgi:hypothetical protein